MHGVAQEYDETMVDGLLVEEQLDGTAITTDRVGLSCAGKYRFISFEEALQHLDGLFDLDIECPEPIEYISGEDVLELAQLEPGPNARNKVRK
jgi:hypothetical protein